MTMKVLKLQRPKGNAYYYTRAMRRVIENHMSIIRERGVDRVEPINGRQYDKYQGDFYGLLIELNVPAEMHWATLRLNGLHSPIDWVGIESPVMLVKVNVISDLLDRHLSTLARL